jgi:CRP/FNR family transcriptional regulator
MTKIDETYGDRPGRAGSSDPWRPGAHPPTILMNRRFERFSPLLLRDREYLRALCSRSRPVGARRQILAEKQRCDSLHVLTAGWALEYQTLARGRRQVIRVRLPGEVLGSECIIYGRSMQSVQALTQCAVAEIPRDEYVGLHQRHPRIVSALYAMSAFDRAVLQQWTLSLGRRDASSRVAHILLEIEQRCRLSSLSDGLTTPFPLTQQDLADCLGLTLPYLNRVLSSLRREGLIELERQTLVVLNRPKLAQKAEFECSYLDLPPIPASAGNGEKEPGVGPEIQGSTRLAVG